MIYSFFEERNKEGPVRFLGARKKNQKNIHLLQGLPLYWEDANRELQKPPILCGFW
jgi:hypothetical protein